MTAPEIRFDPDGIEMAGGLLWLDARRPKPFSVITHAHGDHVARHPRILCTPETAALVRKRNGHKADYVERRYGEPTVVGDLRVTLLSAGHVLGSAMVLLEGAGRRVLYTGDVRLRGGLTCPPAHPVAADVLITEATYGRPDHRLPDPVDARAELVQFAREALEAGETPVFLAYAFGKAQEVMAALAAADVPVAAHGTAWNVCAVYRAFGISFPGSRKLRDKGNRKAAIVVPPRFVNVPEVRRAAPLRVAAVTGWGARVLGDGVDAVIRLSDHGDFDELLALVATVAPREVFVLHGYADEFAAELNARGYTAHAVPGHSGPEEGTRPGMFGKTRRDASRDA